MERLPPTDDADLDALRDAGWITGTRLTAARLFDTVRTGPDPSGAMHRLAVLARTQPGLMRTVIDDEALGARLVALVGASRALTAVLARSSNPLDVLAGDAPPEPPTMSGLATWLREALVGVAAADLVGEIDMPEATRRVSLLADTAARVVVDSVGHGEVHLAVIALGKWGGSELNYASDIDLVFVHEGSDTGAHAAAAEVVARLGARDAAGPAFRVDVGLRPEGAAGPLSRTLDSYRTYWERWAETWELQALIKARFVAGDPELGAAFVAALPEVVFPEQLGADSVRSIRAMKQRTEQLVGGEVIELKRGAGGIRDIEFAVQMLQLVHGRADPTLRTPTTLEALERLADGGYIGTEDAVLLADAYRWLRDAEHRIQLVDLRQTHTLPADPTEREHIARAMGYRDTNEAPALDLFEADLRARRMQVRSIHQALFHRPVLEALAESKTSAMTIEAVSRQLQALGFLDTAATRRAVADLTSGLSRRSALMRHMLPLIMEWLSLAPDPDLGLAQLRLLLAESPDTSAVVTALRDDPLASERICTVLGTSRLVGDLIDRLPPSIPLFGDDAALRRAPSRDELLEEALGRSALRTDPTDALRRFHAEHVLRIAVADITGLANDIEVGSRLSALSDATVQAAITAASREAGFSGPLCVVAMGKWGGEELNYASDLDAIVVTATPDDVPAATEVIERTVAILGGPAAGLPSLDLDLDLRPEGRKGALVRSAESFDAYYRQWAETWEFQAMLRARPAAGDAGLGRRLIDSVAGHAAPYRPERDQEIRAMKARIESERIPIDEDPDFHLKLGRGTLSDVEWTVQLLQLRHDRPDLRTPSTLQGLHRLADAGLIDRDDASTLEVAYRFCARARNRLFLRWGRHRDSLPTDPLEATRLARSLGYTESPRTAMREDYRRVTRRARRVVERLFYGIHPAGS